MSLLNNFKQNRPGSEHENSTEYLNAYPNIITRIGEDVCFSRRLLRNAGWPDGWRGRVGMVADEKKIVVTLERV